MRSFPASALALVALLAAACGGSVTDPKGGNSNGALSGDGEHGGAGGAAGGSAGGSAGVGGAPGDACHADTDCRLVGAPCQLCADGTSACPETRCEAGQCVVAWSTCPAPAVDGGAGGSSSDGGSAPGCVSDGDCAAPAVCQVCSDGQNYSCATGACIYGRCEVVWPACPALDAGAPLVSCGGFAGTPCPGAGKCVDVPNDGCDPQHGGADCAGMCACSGALVDCVPGYAFDADPRVCTCVKSP